MSARPVLNTAPAPALAAAPAPPTHDWFDRPMRWAQLTLVENDPAQYDVRFWLDYFKEIGADAACLSAGGCVAYYPTQIPLHYRRHYPRVPPRARRHQRARPFHPGPRGRRRRHLSHLGPPTPIRGNVN
jgi:hypothetical protein